MHCSRQDNVVGLNARELFEDGERRVAEAGALLPHLEALPERESEEANEDVSLDPVSKTNEPAIFFFFKN